MHYAQILKRSWKILWAYPALWVFGIILALTTASVSSSSNGFSSSSSNNPSSNPSTTPGGAWNQVVQGFNQAWNQFTETLKTPSFERTLIELVIGLIVLLILVGILFTIGKYVSRVALIRMVDGYETSGEKVSWRQGFRLGWSKAAWRLFLIDLVIGLPIFVVFMVLAVIAALPVILGLIAGGALTLVGIIPTIGLVFLVIFLGLLVALAMALVMEIIWRVCVLEQRGVFDAIRRGWQIVRQNLKQIFLMWLILLGISIGYGLATIPAALVLVLVGVLVGGLVGLVLYLLVHVAATVTVAAIVAAIVGVLLFLLVLGLPLLFLGGLKQTYFSTAWTLVYRELKPMLPEAAVLPETLVPAGEGDAAPAV